ncbi:MAG: enoyl-CoA hydratase/isomerase family protein [Chloroflexi bacterium]|nr:enoyl-CoA hydratase/isomerase family protein [Chloroflexota bacterium]
MTSMHRETLLYHKDEGTAWITLNRPGAQNRVNPQMAAELREVCSAIGEDEDVLVVVVTGAGEVFCTGDEEPSTSHAPTEGGTSYLESWRVAHALGIIEKPVIAAINGDALGHGLEIGLACDIRIAAENARLGLPNICQGTMPWDGGTQRLPRVVGKAWATYLLLTGRTVDASEALQIGLVHQVVPSGVLAERASQLARSMASMAPIAMRYVKEAVHKGMDMTLEQGLRLETDLNLILQTTEDRAEGIASFLARRQPRFTGR